MGGIGIQGSRHVHSTTHAHGWGFWMPWPCILEAPSLELPMHRPMSNFRHSRTSVRSVTNDWPVVVLHCMTATGLSTTASVTNHKITEHCSLPVISWVVSSCKEYIPAFLMSAEMLSWIKCLIASITAFRVVLDRRVIREPLPCVPEACICLLF